MTEKRYFVTCEVGNVICELISRKLSDDEFEHLTYYDIVDRLNQLTAENEQLKQELKIYRKIANCSNCEYQNYDWYDDGDEFEICERGNNEQQIEYHICEEWREL